MAGATLLRALALAAEAVDPHAAGTVPAGADPLRLDLPTLGPASGETPSAATLRVFGSLYLAAELEQAGVVPIAELLADQRDSLNLTSYDAAAKLDDFATRERGWYDRAGRVALYARLFGVGPGATNDAGALVNRDFASLLASLCHALTSAVTTSTSGTLGPSTIAGIQAAATALLENLAARALGNTLLAAQRIEDQVRHAVDVLRDQAICALVGARTLQETIVNILGKDAPDVQRLLDLGTAGQKVIVWLADELPQLTGDSDGSALAAAAGSAAVSATLWLNANGIQAAPQELLAA